MSLYNLSTQDLNGIPLNITFGVEDAIKDPTKPMFLKVDSGTYTPMYYYVSKLVSVTMSPSDPGKSPFNVVAGPITYTFTKDAWGEWTIEYQAAGPIFLK